ncbi:MAG: hypothetical protein RLZ98_1352 [Pseudomonadota bacterium]|jgi:ribosomal-protein-alanine N-acetyltransferase
MVFLKNGPAFGETLSVFGEKVWLRPPNSFDYAAWAELRARSRDHLVPWEPKWSRDELSRPSFRRRLRHYQRELREDLGYAFFIYRRADDALVGGVTLSNVRRGVAQTASLGYWMGEPYVRRGYMSDAVAAATQFAFAEINLHRVEAACLQNNFASQKVLERNGFVREGLARKYLKINGAWQDHLLFALLVDEHESGEGST